MKTIALKLYSFSELKPDIAKKVILQLSDINVNEDWWENMYTDAAMIGLKITSFNADLSIIQGKLTSPINHVIREIVENHGKNTDTYVTAMRYKNIYSDDTDALEIEFLHDLLKNYIKMLKEEYDFLTSDEEIKNSIEINEYTFEVDGTMRNE